VAIPVSLIVAGLLAVIAGGVYLFAERTAHIRLQRRLERLALEARYVGTPGGYLVFDERDHLLSTSPPAISEAGDELQIVSDPVWGALAVLRLPVTTVGPHMVAVPTRDEVKALLALRRALIGMTAAGALAALVAGYVLAVVAFRPVDDAMRERHEFIALASHQLRTPLSIIRTSVELARTGLGVTHEEALETVLRQTHRMDALTARLTALAKAESSARRPVGETDVVAVAADVVAALRPAASLAGVTLQLDAPPRLWIRAEPAETDDMLTAVVDNAIKFSPRRGTVIVRVGLDQWKAVVEVSDQGPGISVEDLPHIARPFVQGRSARGGYGLGLAIARAVAERCGGQLSIAPASGQGTTVRLALPVPRRASTPEMSLQNRRLPQGSPPT